LLPLDVDLFDKEPDLENKLTSADEVLSQKIATTLLKEEFQNLKVSAFSF
jgi:hypothetical protein